MVHRHGAHVCQVTMLCFNCGKIQTGREMGKTYDFV